GDPPGHDVEQEVPLAWAELEAGARDEVVEADDGVLERRLRGDATVRAEGVVASHAFPPRAPGMPERQTRRSRSGGSGGSPRLPLVRVTRRTRRSRGRDSARIILIGAIRTGISVGNGACRR